LRFSCFFILFCHDFMDFGQIFAGWKLVILY